MSERFESLGLDNSGVTRARMDYLRYVTFVAALERGASVIGVVSPTLVAANIPLTKYFWHEKGWGGKNFTSIARSYTCTRVSTARLERDFSKKKSSFPPERLLIGSKHACDELVVAWNHNIPWGCAMPKEELPWGGRP